MIKKLIRKYLVYRAQKEYVLKSVFAEEEQVLSDPNSEQFDAMTDIAYNWLAEEAPKFLAGVCFIIAGFLIVGGILACM